MKERADPTRPHYGSDLVNIDGLSKDCALLKYEGDGVGESRLSVPTCVAAHVACSTTEPDR